MNKLLSIVIPVYKVEKYIDKCISSLLVPDKQQLQLLDIVVINDGTPDNSAILAKAYEKQYPGIVRVIDQENRGHGGAWNHGTELAVGKYLFYLDSDDWFETSELSKLIGFLKGCDADMVMLDGKKYYAEQDKYVNTNRHIKLTPNQIYDADTFPWSKVGPGYDMTFAHDTVYRTAMMQKYQPLFCEHVMYDDVALQMIPVAIAQNFVYIPLDIYRYYIGRPGQSFDPKVRAIRSADDVSKVLACLFDWYRTHKDLIPAGGSRLAYVEENYQALGVYHYAELSRLGAEKAQPRLEAWDKLIREKYADIEPDETVRMYRTLPYGVFIRWLRCYDWSRRVIGKIKRRVNR